MLKKLMSLLNVKREPVTECRHCGSKSIRDLEGQLYCGECNAYF